MKRSQSFEQKNDDYDWYAAVDKKKKKIDQHIDFLIICLKIGK